MAWWRFILWAVVVTIALVFLWLVRGVLLPFVIAWIIAIVLEPVVQALSSRGLPRRLSIGAITAAFFLAAVAFGLWIGPRVAGQLGELQRTTQELTSSIAEESQAENHFVRWNPAVRAQPPGPLGAVDRTLDQLAPLLDRLGLPSTRRAIFDQYLAPQRDQLAEGIGAFFNGFFRILVGAASQLFLFVFVPLLVFFFLADMDSYRPKMMAVIPPALRPGLSSLLQEVGDVFKSYLRGVLFNVTVYTCVFALLFSLGGLPFPILLGLLAGSLFLIPMLGGAIMAVSLALIVGITGDSSTWFFAFPNSWMFGLGAAGVFWALHTVYDIIVTPRMLGGAVGLDSVLSLFVIFSGGALFGLPGMIIAYPLAGAVKVTLARVLGVTHQSTADAALSLPSVPLRHRGETAAQVDGEA